MIFELCFAGIMWMMGDVEDSQNDKIDELKDKITDLEEEIRTQH